MTTIIQMARPDDASEMLSIYTPIVEKTAISFELTPPDLAEFTQRVEKTLDQYPWLVCVIDGYIAGYAYASAHRSRGAYGWSAEASVYVSPDYRGRGAARGLYHTLFECLTLQGYHNVYAGLMVPNPPSEALHQALGFTYVGVFQRIGYKFGRWHDVAWYHLRLQPDANGLPKSPCSIQSLINQKAFATALQAGQTLLR